MKFRIVLVGTLYSSNVGSVARVMGNMGGEQLILINPQCEINSKARQGAAGAQKWLERRTIYQNWQQFYEHEGSGVRFAFTRRDGKQRLVLPFEEQLGHFDQVTEQHQGEPVYLIFGPEDNGLSAEDLDMANYRCSLPTFGEYASMNLSHAVLLAGYLFQNHQAQQDSRTDRHVNNTKSEPKCVRSKPLRFPDQAIREWITSMGFDIEARKASAYITLKRILLQNAPAESDLMVFEAILQQNIRKLKEHRELTCNSDGSTSGPDLF